MRSRVRTPPGPPANLLKPRLLSRYRWARHRAVNSGCECRPYHLFGCLPPERTSKQKSCSRAYPTVDPFRLAAGADPLADGLFDVCKSCRALSKAILQSTLNSKSLWVIAPMQTTACLRHAPVPVELGVRLLHSPPRAQPENGSARGLRVPPGGGAADPEGKDNGDE